jgi:hypothetical protein
MTRRILICSIIAIASMMLLASCSDVQKEETYPNKYECFLNSDNI